jgi:hypothetical protein
MALGDVADVSGYFPLIYVLDVPAVDVDCTLFEFVEFV